MNEQRKDIIRAPIKVFKKPAVETADYMLACYMRKLEVSQSLTPLDYLYAFIDFNWFTVACIILIAPPPPFASFKLSTVLWSTINF